MQIIRASEMGFCFGVRRAVEMMEDAVKERGPMVSLGSVVHNPQVVEKLRGEGLDVIKDVSRGRAPPRRHHRPRRRRQVIQDLEASGAEIIDTTCPIVTRSQQWAKRLSEEGFAVVIFGDPNHKEMRGVQGWAKGHVQSGPPRTTSSCCRTTSRPASACSRRPPRRRPASPPS